jgi:hypothetical protein
MLSHLASCDIARPADVLDLGDYCCFFAPPNLVEGIMMSDLLGAIEEVDRERQRQRERAVEID